VGRAIRFCAPSTEGVGRLLNRRELWFAAEGALHDLWEADRSLRSTRRAHEWVPSPGTQHRVCGFHLELCASLSIALVPRADKARKLMPARVPEKTRPTHGRRSASFAITAAICWRAQRGCDIALHRELLRCL
jgi:hypothetical protein